MSWKLFWILCSLQQGGLSSGYKNFIADNEIADETYSEDGLALFRVQGSGQYNMQAIQVDPVCPEFTFGGSFYCQQNICRQKYSYLAYSILGRLHFSPTKSYILICPTEFWMFLYIPL